MKRALVACALIGCTQPTTSSVGDPVLGGNVCAIYTTAGACGSDAACTWLGTGCACPPDNPNCGCPDGTCASVDGSDTGPPTCACANGAVCVAENAEPLTCVTPSPGSSDPCTRIVGLTCEASSTIGGLCVCE
ncbi:MAG TPA: hypothetical protein VH143_31315 [Kofleriaceae bacterium]|nr:hypothetical protein [Kofleriaceae bacterium]